MFKLKAVYQEKDFCWTFVAPVVPVVAVPPVIQTESAKRVKRKKIHDLKVMARMM